MEPVSTLLLVLHSLLQAIIKAEAQASRFKHKLQLLKSKVEILIKKLQEIDKLGPQMQDKFPREETLRLCGLLEGAKDVISSCSNVRWYKFNFKRYEKKIDIISAALDEFLRVNLQLAQYEQILQVLVHVTELTKKLNLTSSSTAPHSSEGSSSSKNHHGFASPSSSATSTPITPSSPMSTPLTPSSDGGSTSSSRRFRRVQFKQTIETEYTFDEVG